MATGRVPTTANSPLTAKGDLFTYSTAPARLAVGNNGEQIVADSSATSGLRYNPQNALANPIINGGMDIWQRGTSISVTASTKPFVSDRWNISVGANQASTVARQATSDTTNLPNIQYAARVQRNSGQTGTGNIQLFQSLETAQSVPFAGKAITVSFYARAGANYSATSSALYSVLYYGTGTDQNILNTYTGTTAVGSSTVTLTTTWQRFVFTGTVSALATELALGFEFTPTGTASTNDWYEVTGLQIDLGTYTASSAPAFRRSGGTIQGELAACQRYYFRASVGAIGNAIATSTTAFEGNLPLPVAMRITPATLDSSATRLSDGVTVTNTATLLLNAANSNLTSAYLTGTVASGLTQYRPYCFSANAGYYGFSAEL